MGPPGTCLVIDARPRAPRGLLAEHPLLGEPILQHHLGLARDLAAGRILILAAAEDRARLEALAGPLAGVEWPGSAGEVPEGVPVLRTDRLYDPGRLRAARRRGGRAERAEIWRLDDPAHLASAEEELLRRRTYQPLGRYWALGPARRLAVALRPTRVRPNALTLAAFALMAAAAGVVASGTVLGPAGGVLAAVAMAAALVLDTADGHLARLQGTSSAFGRWLDAVLDEAADLLLHGAIAWSQFLRTGEAAWLVLGMAYAAGKYVFAFGNLAWDLDRGRPAESASPARDRAGTGPRVLRRLVAWAGHADIRWHAWIVLAAAGRLDAALVAYSLYYPARALAGVRRKWRSAAHG